MVQIGDKYRVVPAFIGKVEYLGGDIVGQVEQIFPKGRFAVLALAGAFGVARECFPLEELTENRKVGKRRGKM